MDTAGDNDQFVQMLFGLYFFVLISITIEYFNRFLCYIKPRVPFNPPHLYTPVFLPTLTYTPTNT